MSAGGSGEQEVSTKAARLTPLLRSVDTRPAGLPGTLTIGAATLLAFEA